MSYIAISCFLVTIAASLLITVWAARRSRSRADFFVAGGKITSLQNGLAISGDFLSATSFLGLTAMYFTSGIDPVATYLIAPLIGLPLMLLWIAGPLRRAGKFTLGDVMTSRLGSPSLRLFSGVTVVIISVIYLVGQLVGAGGLIAIMFGLQFSVSVILVGVLMTLYVALGGMLAATWVQIVKAVLLIAAVVGIAALALIQAGGPGPLYARAAAAHPQSLTLFAPGGSGMSLFSSLSLMFGMVIGIMSLPHLLIRIFTVPDEMAARGSMVGAVTIVGAVFALLGGVVGPASIAFVLGRPEFLDAAGGLRGGANMASIHLSEALGGPVLMGIVAAVAFATILAAVSGLVIAIATAAAHDIYGVLAPKAEANERREVAVFRISAAGMAAVAVALAFAFQHENVALLTALALSVAASANFPILALVLYWPRLTTAGALAGGVAGLVGSVALIVLGPAVWVKILHHAAPLFPSDYPALVTVPLAFVVAVAVSRLERAPKAQPAPQV
jgi:cation/acetate symporter